MPSSSPCRRSTSWQPAITPWKPWATSNTAAFISVTRASRARLASPLRTRCNVSTAARVQTDQCPSRPPTIRAVTSQGPTRRAKGVSRSATIWSSFPV